MSNPLVLLDDARPGQERLRVFSAPDGIVEAHLPNEVEPALAALDRARQRGRFVAGYFSYELGYLLEPKLARLLPERRSVPLLWFGIFSSVQEFAGTDADRWLVNNSEGRAYAGPLRYGETPASYADQFSRVASYIAAGDAYQANLTFPARFGFAGNPLALYWRLRGRTQGGHGAYIGDGRRSILSFSPELFFRIENGVLTARPMKGTAARGATAEDDARLRENLAASDKDRAENLMIVDLIRNDMARVAKLGTVKVDEMFEIETYPTVHQMVSTVTAELRNDIGIADILRALFPCGSITGAPKVRAMEIIRELEGEPRGAYCGAVGCFAPDGSAMFNVAIRTLTIGNNEGTLNIGSGIVADSQPGAEYGECLVKARYYTEERPTISLIETLGHEPGAGFVRSDRHLARLAHSAKALGLPFDRDVVLRAMTDAVNGSDGASRLRLELKEDGSIDMRSQPLAPNPPVWTYAVSEMRVSSGDILSRHKTSWRALYDDEFAKLHAVTGCDQVLFLNERGEVAEGNTANVFLRRGGQFLTPPLSSGALDGVLRRALLDDRTCNERVLTLADLENGEMHFGNSLRGLIRARQVDQARAAAPLRNIM